MNIPDAWTRVTYSIQNAHCLMKTCIKPKFRLILTREYYLFESSDSDHYTLDPNSSSVDRIDSLLIVYKGSI